ERRVHLLAGRQPPEPGALSLADRHAQSHPVLFEMDDEYVQGMPGNLLHLDSVDLSHPMGRIDHEIASAETKLLRHHLISRIAIDPIGTRYLPTPRQHTRCRHHKH